MPWIKPSEKLPENDDIVVIAQSKCIYTGCYVKDDGTWQDVWFVFIREEEMFKSEEIDYWMPIPELPKEK